VHQQRCSALLALRYMQLAYISRHGCW
jgi:hypothetical protein